MVDLLFCACLSTSLHILFGSKEHFQEYNAQHIELLTQMKDSCNHSFKLLKKRIFNELLIFVAVLVKCTLTML